MRLPSPAPVAGAGLDVLTQAGNVLVPAGAAHVIALQLRAQVFVLEPHRGQITVRLDRRTSSPVLRQASLPQIITVPWWGGRTLRYRYD